jgi:hypothetical protein
MLEGDDVFDLVHEQRDGRQFERADLPWLETERLPYPGDGRLRHPQSDAANPRVDECVAL